MNQPNWIITTILAALAGFLFPYFIQSVLFALRIFRRTNIEGKWYNYHITRRDGKAIIEEGFWKIRKGFFHKYTVTAYKEGVSNLFYKGTLNFERNYWLVKFKAAKHEEEVSVRLHNPIPSEDTYTYGLFISLDFQGEAISGPVLISREELSLDKAEEILLTKTKIDINMKLLNI